MSVVRINLLSVLMLLIVASIVTAAMIPPLLKARERSRRDQCQLHMQFLAGGIRAYTNANDVLPEAAHAHNLGMWLPGEYGELIADPASTTWLYQLSDYLDDSTLAAPKPDNWRTLSVPLFLCPSDDYNREPYLGKFARANYAINLGPSWVTVAPGKQTKSADGTIHWLADGVSGLNRSVRIEDFENGEAKIVALEEIRAGVTSADSRGVWGLGMVGASSTFTHGVFGDDGGPNYKSKWADDIYGGPIVARQLGAGKLAKLNMECCDYLNMPKQATARSMHINGVFCMMLDGACKFITNDVDRFVWHTMHSRYAAKGVVNQERLQREWDKTVEEFSKRGITLP